MQKLFKTLQGSVSFWFVLFMSLAFFFMRLPSFFEPYWYGDEGIYEVLGFGIRHGRLLYQDLWDNKPPLLYLIYALFNGDQAPVKIFSFIVGLIAVILFFFLAKKLLIKTFSATLATFFFTLLLGLPLIEGNIANAENFMILPSVASALLVLHTTTPGGKKKQPLLLFLTGTLLGISFLIKVVAVFDFGAFCLFLLITQYQSVKLLYKQILHTVIPFTFGFIIPLFCTMLFFASRGILHMFIQSAFLSNIGYVNYGNQFLIPQGLLIIKSLLLFGVIFIVFIKRKVISTPSLFIFLWSSFSLYSALFSQRPYAHYVLLTIASFSLLIGLSLSKKTTIITLIFLLSVLFIIAKNFGVYSTTSRYYENFFSFVTGTKTVEDYQGFFDKSVVRDYALADYITSHKQANSTLFVWGNSAQIYKLANMLPPGRYTVAYHITTNQQTLEETAKVLQQTMPTYVIILGNASPFPYHLTHYQERFGNEDGFVYEKIL